MALTKISTGVIADNAIDSEHYTDGSADNVHLATGIDAAKLIGTVADARFPATLPAMSGANLTALAAANLTGTVADARFPATLPAMSGVNLTNIVATAGKHTIWIPAGAMRPRVSNGCAAIADVETTAGRPDMTVLDFDNSADEFAQFSVAFPKSWNLGTITFQVWWTGLAATTGVAWGLQGTSNADNTTLDAVFGTAVVVTDDAQGAVEEVLVTAESGAVTIANTPADNDICIFQVFRDVSDGNDDMAGDARLLGIKLFFSTDAEMDA